MAKKRRSTRSVTTFSDDESEVTAEVAEDSDEVAEEETDSDDSAEESESDAGDEDAEETPESLTVDVKLESTKQFVKKLAANIQEETTIIFKMGGTTVAAAECVYGEDVLVRILPTSHAADLAQFLYDGFNGEGQDPQTVNGIDKNGYNYSLKIDW